MPDLNHTGPRGPSFELPLTPREQALVVQAEALAAELIGPHAAGWEQGREALPRDLFRRYGSDGFSGLMVPLADGGQGASFLCKVIVAETMARTCMAATFALNNTQGSVVRLVREGTPDQRERYLARLLSGELVCAPSLTEPGAGSDATAMALSAVPTDGGWQLNGTKSWVTNGVHADLLVLYAQTQPGAGAKGIASFLVDLNTPGVGPRTAHSLIGGSAMARPRSPSRTSSFPRPTLRRRRGRRSGPRCRASPPRASTSPPW